MTVAWTILDPASEIPPDPRRASQSQSPFTNIHGQFCGVPEIFVTVSPAYAARSKCSFHYLRSKILNVKGIGTFNREFQAV